MSDQLRDSGRRADYETVREELSRYWRPYLAAVLTAAVLIMGFVAASAERSSERITTAAPASAPSLAAAVEVETTSPGLKPESAYDIADQKAVERLVRAGNRATGGQDTVGLNEDLFLTGTTYKVTSVRTAKALGDGYTRVEANGTFLVLNVSLTNGKNKPATILSNALQVIGNNGSSYSTSDDAWLAVSDQLILLEEIQPGLTESGTLVYDLPSDAVAGAQLEVRDLFSSAKGRVKLGL